MTLLVLGLLIFLGPHSVRIFADEWRAARMRAMGLNAWKGVYSLISLAGFALIVVGFGETRGMPELWNPPVWTRHVTALLLLPAFVLLAAAYVPGTHIKAAVGHPMVAGVKLWAFAHLLSTGRPGNVLLFGAFLAWAIVDYVSARRRDRATGTRYPAGPWSRDAVAGVIGVVAWGLFAKWGHARLIGVAPLG
jgi:uncharacterized membrane protein